jgi:membrane protease YdiL (CAAX protease family)
MTDIDILLQGQGGRTDTIPRSQRLALCFVLAMLAMLPAQLYRLGQTEALPWLLADYAGRIAAVAVIFILPAGRWCLRQRDDLKVGTLEAGLWIVGIALLFRLAPIDNYLFSAFPQLPLGNYPAPKGVLYAFDITLGLALVALHEELVFRKLGAQVFAALGWGAWRTILVTSLLFGLYHWWRAPAGMIAAGLYGIVAMICYRRTGSLWPVGFAHYLVDYFAFA